MRRTLDSWRGDSWRCVCAQLRGCMGLVDKTLGSLAAKRDASKADVFPVSVKGEE